jgi:xanthosine utilization system XapX-like protein
VGVGVGALLCETLSRQRVEVGLVPVGAFGMSLFAADLWLACSGLPGSGLQGVSQFLSQTAHWRVLFDLGMLSLSAGVYSVPMYALIQVRSPDSHRARIIAANNILNAIFMIASSLIVGAMLGAGVSIPEVFGWLALGNAAVVGLLCLAVPEFVERWVGWSRREAPRSLDGR